jgi:hypothetical protein
MAVRSSVTSPFQPASVDRTLRSSGRAAGWQPGDDRIRSASSIGVLVKSFRLRDITDLDVSCRPEVRARLFIAQLRRRQWLPQ